MAQAGVILVKHVFAPNPPHSSWMVPPAPKAQLNMGHTPTPHVSPMVLPNSATDVSMIPAISVGFEPMDSTVWFGDAKEAWIPFEASAPRPQVRTASIYTPPNTARRIPVAVPKPQPVPEGKSTPAVASTCVIEVIE